MGISHSMILPPVPAWLALVTFGGLLAAGVALSINSTTILAGLLGIVLGYQNGLAFIARDSGILVVAGVVACVFVLLTLVSSLVVVANADWIKIAIRVIGSWIAASGMFLFGWSFR